MSDELRTCPACGNKDIHILHSDSYEAWCECVKCHLRSPLEACVYAAMQSWNSLPRREDAQELVDALGEVLKIADDYFDDDIRLGAELIDDISPKLRSALAKWGK